MIRIGIFIMVIFHCASVRAQSVKIYIRNNPSNATSASASIQLKWFDEKTIFKKGEVNVYRRSGSGLWKKLNDKPLKKGEYSIPVEILRRDSSLIAFTDILKKIPDDSIKGFLFLGLLLKSFESSEFAKFAAVMYEDTNVEKGKKYQYKIMQVKNGKETELGFTKEIVCGNYLPSLPPKDLQIKSRKRSTEFKWKVETDRYYAVNIYRTSSDSAKEIKLTPQPLMVSKKVDKNGNKSYGESFYTDKNLRENITYTYRLTALDFFGYETDFSQRVAAFVADSTAPPTPQYLRFEVLKYQVKLNWEENPDPDLSGYQIYKGKTSTGPFQRINSQLVNPGQPAYQEESASGDFYYYVSATDKAGNESSSNKVFVHVHDLMPPATPENFHVRSDTGRIYLNWLPNKESDLMGYQVYRSVDNEDTVHFVLMNAVPFTDPFYVDSLSKNIKNKFMYRVVAIDSSFNKSKPSKITGAAMPDVTPPEMPLIKNGYMDNKYLKVEWVANADDDLWGYNLYRSSEEDSSSFQQININLLPSHSTHYTDQKTQVGKLYNYYLIAIDSSGNHSVGSPVYPVRNTDSSRAGSIGLTSTKAKFIKKNNQIHLQWELKAGDFLGAVIYRKEKEKEGMVPLTGMLTSKEYFDNDIVKASIYYYEIRIYSQNGSISRSEILKVETEK